MVWEKKLQFTYVRRMRDHRTRKLNVNGETEQKIIIYSYLLIYHSFMLCFLNNKQVTFNFPWNLLHPYDQRMQKIKNFTLNDQRNENLITKTHWGIQSFTQQVLCLEWSWNGLGKKSRTRKMGSNVNLDPNAQYILQ